MNMNKEMNGCMYSGNLDRAFVAYYKGLVIMCSLCLYADDGNTLLGKTPIFLNL